MWRTILLAPNACHREKNTNRRIGLGDPLPEPSSLPPDGSDPTIWRLLLRTCPEVEKEEQCYRQAENLYLVTYWIDWKKEGSALAACNLNGLEPAVAASIRALANHKGILETAAKWGIDPVGLAIALVAAWVAEHNADWDESTDRHANRVRRSLPQGGG